MRGWDELGVVDTIYEDEQEVEEEDDESSKSLSLPPSSPISPRSSSSLLSPPPSLYERVEERTAVTGRTTDVVVRLHDQCFNLHKDPLISRSRYLCRRLTESTDITVNPPPGITADVFAEIVIFCYDSFVQLTPANLAAVRIAAEWLEMGADDGGGNGGLMWQTEIYFRQEVAGDARKAGHVMSACVRLLPDVTAALLAVRCVEVLASEEGDGDWMEELTALPVGVFRVVAESMGTWFAHDHDLLYRIVDYYLENHRENLAEEEKSRVCRTIDCSKLSHDLLLHLVQNPRLPLRFVVQAMLLDQLHTRHAYVHLSSSAAAAMPKQQSSSRTTSLTLGTILQRDAAKRQAAHLRASMEATSFRIESLERDLEGLRRKLRWSEEKRAEMESVRSSSFRVVGGKSSCEGEEEGSTLVVAQKGSGKGLGRKLMNGLKSVFMTSPSPKKAGGGGGGGAGGGGGGGGGGGEKRRVQGHRRNHSFA